jgi:hypothetical protein
MCSIPFFVIAFLLRFLTIEFTHSCHLRGCVPLLAQVVRAGRDPSAHAREASLAGAREWFEDSERKR